MCMFIKFVHLHTLFNIRYKDKLLTLCKRTKNQEIKKNYKTAMRESKNVLQHNMERDDFPLLYSFQKC